MGLMPSMVLGAETPVNIRKDCLVFKVYCAKDTAAYFLVPSRLEWGCSEKRGLSAFSTYLSQKHGFFDILGVKDNEMFGRAFDVVFRSEIGLPFKGGLDPLIFVLGFYCKYEVPSQGRLRLLMACFILLF